MGALQADSLKEEVYHLYKLQILFLFFNSRWWAKRTIDKEDFYHCILYSSEKPDSSPPALFHSPSLTVGGKEGFCS